MQKDHGKNEEHASKKRTTSREKKQTRKGCGGSRKPRVRSWRSPQGCKKGGTANRTEIFLGNVTHRRGDRENRSESQSRRPSFSLHLPAGSLARSCGSSPSPSKKSVIALARLLGSDQKARRERHKNKKSDCPPSEQRRASPLRNDLARAFPRGVPGFAIIAGMTAITIMR